jgi:hypothetical protein
MPAPEWMIGFVSRAPRSTRITPALVIGAFAAIAGILGPAPGLRGQTPTSSDKPDLKPADPRKESLPHLEPFDLSYLPLKAKCILAVRPAAILRREEMKPHVKALEDAIRGLFELDAKADIALRLEGIEEITIGLVRSPEPGERVPNFPWGSDSGCLVVRAGEALDWQKRIGDFYRLVLKQQCDWVDVPLEGKTYHKLRVHGQPYPDPDPWPDWCFFFPNARTVVLADEACLREVIRRPARTQPELARDRAWQEIHRGLIAAACEQDAPDDEPDLVSEWFADLLLGFVPQLGKPHRLFSGIAEDQTLRSRASRTYLNAKDAGAAALKITEQLATLTPGVTAVGPEAEKEIEPSERFVFRCLLELPKNCRVHCNGRTVEIATEARMPLAELTDFIRAALGELASDPDNKPATDKPAQRVTR